MIIAIYDLIIGISILYQYSTPMVLWLYMVPEWITFTKIFIGIFGTIIGLGIFRRGEHKLVLPFSALLAIYIAIDFMRIGLEFLPHAGSSLVFLLLAALTIKLTEGFDLEKRKIFRESKVLIFIGTGLTPYILTGWISYDWFEFLHQ